MRFLIRFFVYFLISPCALLLAQEQEEVKSKREYYDEFQQIFEFVDRDYVEEPDRQKMTDHAIRGMLHSLDPNSEYYTDEDLKQFLDDKQGEFGGIGVVITSDSGAAKVIAPIDDLPAATAGVKSGDYILAVDGKSVPSMGFYKAAKVIKGKPGTKVTITVFTEGDEKPRDLELQRSIVKINSVKSRLDKGNIAYFRVSTFNHNTSKLLKEHMVKISSLSKEEIKGIIIDLRNNPGGPLDEAIEMCNYFLESGIIITKKGRTKDSSGQEMVKSRGYKILDTPIIVMINGGSASASEIVAGALQDHKRAIILGTKSFGKGSIQSFFEFTNRSGAKITTANYYTPSGKSIHGKGIDPDIEIVLPESIKYSEDKKDVFSEKFISSHLNSTPKSKNNSKKKITDLLDFKEHYDQDFQFARAHDLLTGIILSKEMK